MASVSDDRLVYEVGGTLKTQLRRYQRRFLYYCRFMLSDRTARWCRNPRWPTTATGEGVEEPTAETAEVEEPTAETAEATSRFLRFLTSRRPLAETSNLMAQVYIYAQALLASRPNILRAPIYRSGEALLASRQPVASVTGLGTNSFRTRMLEEGLTMQDSDDPPAETSNPVANPPTTLEEVAPVVEPNVSEEVPGKTSKESVCGIVGGGMKPGSAFTLVALGAMGLLELKAQARFPFRTNPQISKVACTTLLLCGLAAIADHVISSTPLGPNSGYAIAARWGVYVSAFVMAGSLASLLYI